MFITAEMRWFWPACPSDLKSWFFDHAPTPGGGQPRCDEYLRHPNQSELGIKKRGTQDYVEVKGLVATLRHPNLMPLAPHHEFWCKWTSENLSLDKQNSFVTEKVRWIRKFDTSQFTVVEVPLGPEEAPLDGISRREGCNLSLTNVQIVGVSRRWWTFGFEAYGNFESVSNNLRAATNYVRAQSFPKPNGSFLSYPAWLSQFAAKAVIATA